MPVKMSMEKRKEKVNPYAIATAMAKKKGFKNFAEDSKGDKYRDKITEGIKESEGIKKSEPKIQNFCSKSCVDTGLKSREACPQFQI